MVKIENLTKICKRKKVLDNINYTFENGKVYGLCGANGSGKTMLLRSIAGLIRANSGSVLINDKVLHKDITFPNSLGIIIENMELLPYLNSRDNLALLAKIKKIATKDDIEDSLKRVGLDSELKVEKYSLGMKQKLNIAQAIFEKPELILLDEPTNALDEKSIELVHKIIREEAERGAVVIIASHNKYDIEACCDHIIKMNNGCMEVIQ